MILNQMCPNWSYLIHALSSRFALCRALSRFALVWKRGSVWKCESVKEPSVPPLNNDFESNVPQLFILDWRAFVAKSALSRFALFGGHLWPKYVGRGHRNILKDRGHQYLTSLIGVFLMKFETLLGMSDLQRKLMRVLSSRTISFTHLEDTVVQNWTMRRGK